MRPRVLATLIAFAFLYMISPLVLPISMGAVLAVLFFPWLKRLETRKISTGVGSGFLTLGITILIILPASSLIYFAAKSAFLLVQSMKAAPVVSPSGGTLLDSWILLPKVHGIMEWVTARFPVGAPQLTDGIQELARSVGIRVAEILGGILRQLPGMAVSMGIMVVSVYFFLVDGRTVVAYIRRNSVFTPPQTDVLLETGGEMCRSVILAALVSGGIQSILEVITCVATGTPNVALIGLLVFVGSFIPLVGSAPVTFAVAMQQFLTGRTEAAVVLLIMALVIVAVDNMIRPLFLKGSTNLHPFLAFIAAFGGLQTLGFLGVFFGPILAALFLVVVEILVHDHSAFTTTSDKL